MKKIITISREYGSGGRTIGKQLINLLGYTFYDKEIIDKAAEESGLSREYIAKNEQNISSSFIYSLMIGSSLVSSGSTGFPNSSHAIATPLVDQVFNAQRKVIIELAKKGPCIIVGRCSDYILKHCEEIDPNDVLDVFIYAPIEDRANRAVSQGKIEANNAIKTVQQIDKRRANHYNTFTEAVWGDRRNYDLLINTSSLGMDDSAKLIAEIAKF